MLPAKVIRLGIGTSIAADVPTLAPVSANKIALVIAPFVPNENIVVGDLTFASFTGSTPKAGAAGAQGVGNDPLTGEQIVTILAPVGGYRWKCTATPGTPQTIYGFALLDATLATVLGTELLPEPVTIAADQDEVDLGPVLLRINPEPIL